MASFLQRCTDEEKQAWSAAARSEGVSLAGWVRSRLNAALTERGEIEAGHSTAGRTRDRNPQAPRSVKAAKPQTIQSLKAAMPKCPHGLPKGFCLNPRCK